MYKIIMERKSSKRKFLENHLSCNLDLKRLKIPNLLKTDFINKEVFVKFLHEKINEIQINKKIKQILLNSLLSKFQSRRSVRILEKYKNKFWKIQDKKRKGDGTMSAQNHYSKVLSSDKYVEKILEVEFEGGLGEKIIKKFINEVISHEFANLISNEIKVPELINWGFYHNNKIEGLFIRMKYIDKKKIKNKISKKISNKIKMFSLELLEKYNFYHGDVNKNNILIDKDNNIWLIDWGEAVFMKSGGFIKSFNL